MEDRIRIRSEEVLSDDWAVLKKTVLDYRRRDGQWETQVRQTYDRGDGAVILPYDPQRSTVLLVRQFRYPAYVTGHREPLIEACAGLLDENDPETAIRKEAEEELGYRLNKIERLFSPYMSPGSVTERLWFFVARYSPADRISAGGGAPGGGRGHRGPGNAARRSAGRHRRRPHCRCQDHHPDPASETEPDLGLIRDRGIPIQPA